MREILLGVWEGSVCMPVVFRGDGCGKGGGGAIFEGGNKDKT